MLILTRFMCMNKKLFVCLFLFIISLSLFAQEDNNYLHEKELELRDLFDEAFAFDGVKYYKSDKEKKECNAKIIEIFDEIFENNNAFEYTFDSLKHIGVRFSDDKQVKLITWNLKFSDGSYTYYGYLQYMIKKKNTVKTFKLIDKSSEIENPSNIYLSDTNWYGCLYYKILANKYAGKKYYTLLGWDGGDYLITRKIIDVLTFSKKGSPRFGKSMFKIDKTKSKRIIFEYSNRAVMSLNYDDKLKMIIYDYLSPQKPIQKGQYQYYGPDGTYDGLRFGKGKWIHYSNIDIKSLRNSGYRAGKSIKKTYRPKKIY